MTDLVVRNTTPGSAPAAPITGVGGQLPEVLQLCNAIAAAGELIPEAYRGKPGAVLLAKMWADKHDIDVFTAIQNIDVIDGKPWVKTQMRVDLAVRAGFEFRVTETSTESCTVEVWQHRHNSGHAMTPKRVGDPITARFDDRPRRTKYKSGAPTPWELHRDDMLFAEACRKADRRYVRTAAGMIDAADIDDMPADVLDTLTGAEEPQDTPVERVALDVDVGTDTSGAPPAETEPPADAVIEDELRALAKAKKQRLADVLRYAGEATVQDIVTNGKAGDVKRWIEANE